MLNLETHSIFTSRHVVFHENTFPYLDSSHTSSNTQSATSFLDWLSYDSSSPFINSNPHKSVSQKSKDIPDISVSHDISQNPVTVITPSFHNEELVLSSSNIDTDPVIHSSSADCLNHIDSEPEPTLPETIIVPVIRQSSRHTQKPKWLSDFYLPSLTKSTVNLVSNPESFLEPKHFFSSCSLSTLD